MKVIADAIVAGSAAETPAGYSRRWAAIAASTAPSICAAGARVGVGVDGAGCRGGELTGDDPASAAPIAAGSSAAATSAPSSPATCPPPCRRRAPGSESAREVLEQFDVEQLGALRLGDQKERVGLALQRQCPLALEAAHVDDPRRCDVGGDQFRLGFA